MRTRCEKPKGNGYSLIEMVVAIGIFAILITLVTGILLGAGATYRKATNIQDVVDNLRFGLELITREMRTGGAFRLISLCGSVGDGVEFIDANVSPIQRRFYYLADTDGISGPDAIVRVAMPDISPIDCTIALRLTSREVRVEALALKLEGAGVNDGQPRITISLRARGLDPKIHLESEMNLQTTVVRRLREPD